MPTRPGPGHAARPASCARASWWHVGDSRGRREKGVVDGVGGLQEQGREAARLGQGEERGWLNGP